MAKMSAGLLYKVDKTKLHVQEFIVRHSVWAINMIVVEDEDSVN